MARPPCRRSPASSRSASRSARASADIRRRSPRSIPAAATASGRRLATRSVRTVLPGSSNTSTAPLYPAIAGSLVAYAPSGVVEARKARGPRVCHLGGPCVQLPAGPPISGENLGKSGPASGHPGAGARRPQARHDVAESGRRRALLADAHSLSPRRAFAARSPLHGCCERGRPAARAAKAPSPHRSPAGVSAMWSAGSPATSPRAPTTSAAGTRAHAGTPGLPPPTSRRRSPRAREHGPCRVRPRRTRTALPPHYRCSECREGQPPAVARSKVSCESRVRGHGGPALTTPLRLLSDVKTRSPLFRRRPGRPVLDDLRARRLKVRRRPLTLRNAVVIRLSASAPPSRPGR